MIQMMVDNGHKWEDIKKYSLGELGVFGRVIQKSELENMKHNLKMNWIANHYDSKGLNDFMNDIDRKQKTKSKQQSAEEINANWNKLKMVFGGMK